MQKKVLLPSLALALCAPFSNAQALEAGNFILRAGVATVIPAKKSGHVIADDSNPQIEADNNSQLGLTASYMLSPNVAIGVLAATPFKHNISSAGTKIGETKHLPPTITAQYHFTSFESAKPYVGVGVNYTVFFDEQVGDTDIELKNSAGLALEAGVDIDLGDDFYANVALWYIDIETEVEMGGNTVIDKIDIDPVSAMLGIGRKF